MFGFPRILNSMAIGRGSVEPEPSPDTRMYSTAARTTVIATSMIVAIIGLTALFVTFIVAMVTFTTQLK